MTGPYLIGIDGGTQSSKVGVYDASGNAVAEGRQELRPMERPAHGVAVHPDDDLWDSIAAASRDAMAAFTGDPGEIAAVGLCTIRCCKAFLTAEGSLVEPVVSWMDDRAYQPYLPDDPSLAYATTSSGYLAHRLTGRFSDAAANNILLQWPIDTDTWQWSDDDALLREYNLTRELLVELQLPGEVIGPLTDEAAAAMGLPAGIPVVTTANDKAVETLGTGALSETAALISLGTYIGGIVPGHLNHKAPAEFWTNFACVPHRYLYESNGIRRGMWTLTWFLDLLGPELAERAAVLGLSREELIEQEAALVPAGSDGLLTVLDWLAPTDKEFRKGVMLGFDARHTRGHVYRSILEAIALTMKHTIDAMCGELGIGLEEIVISGGGARSALFLQIFADVFGITASRNVVEAGAGLGSAICAAVGAGIYPDIEMAAARMTAGKGRESFAPDPANAALYARINQTVTATIRDSTDPVLERTYPIFH